MNNLSITLYTTIHVIVKFHKSVPIRGIDIQHIDLLVLDHFQFHDHVIILALDIVIKVQNSTGAELHHVQDTMKIINN